MTNEYHPLTNSICHHFYDAGGCLFCGLSFQEKTVSKESMTIEDMISHFDNFAEENLADIEKHGRLVVAPNGSWFTEIPKQLRKRIYRFMDSNLIPSLKYESRASLFNPEKAREEVGEENYKKLAAALREIRPSHVVSLGLEVADDKDLESLNKGCTLEDYVIASNHIRSRGAKLCCNILIAPPYIEEPVKKAFETARYAAETLKADELYITPCIPMKGSYFYNDWKEGKWDPISATAASEIYRRIVQEYPLIKAKYKSMRVFSFNGRYGPFKRESRKWSEEEKLAERSRVRKIADSVLG